MLEPARRADQPGPRWGELTETPGATGALRIRQDGLACIAGVTEGRATRPHIVGTIVVPGTRTGSPRHKKNDSATSAMIEQTLLAARFASALATVRAIGEGHRARSLALPLELVEVHGDTVATGPASAVMSLIGWMAANHQFTLIEVRTLEPGA